MNSSDSRLLQKWIPIFGNLTNINPKNYIKIAKYCERMSDYFLNEHSNQNNTIYDFNMLSMNLITLNKLNNLDNVNFIDFIKNDTINCQKITTSISLSHEHLQEMNIAYFSLQQHIEHTIIEQMSISINNIIEKYGGINIDKFYYNCIQIEDFSGFKFNFSCKYLPLLKLRYLKVEKIMNSIESINPKI